MTTRSAVSPLGRLCRQKKSTGITTSRTDEVVSLPTSDPLFLPADFSLPYVPIPPADAVAPPLVPSLVCSGLFAGLSPVPLQADVMPPPTPPESLGLPAPLRPYEEMLSSVPMQEIQMQEIPMQERDCLVPASGSSAGFELISVIFERLLGVKLVLDARSAAYLPTAQQVIDIRDLTGTRFGTLSDHELADIALDFTVVCLDSRIAHDLASFSYLFPKATLHRTRLTERVIAQRMRIFKCEAPYWANPVHHVIRPVEMPSYAEVVLAFIRASEGIDPLVFRSVPISHSIRDFCQFGFF